MKTGAALVVGLLFLGGIARADERKSLLPPHETVMTRNGATVYYFPNPNIPLFEVRLEFEGGSDLDPAGRSGLGVFSAGMIEHGVKGLDEDEVARRLDDVAGGVEVGVEEEGTVVSAFGLTNKAPQIVSMLFRELGEPTFPTEPFKRLKRNHLDGIEQLKDNPAELASEVLDTIVFNRTIKARPGRGLLTDVRGLALNDARDYLKRLIRTDRLRALVVGGVARRDVLDKVVAGIEKMGCPECGKTAGPPPPADFEAAHVPSGSLVLVDRPGISEAYVHMGFIGPKRAVPEFYDLRVAETILSGPFASRLNTVIREKLGLTYSISASFSFGTQTGEFNVATSTRNEKLIELLAQVNRMLGEFATGEVTDKELVGARDFLAGSFSLGLDSIYAIADAFFSSLRDGLGPDNIDRYVDGVNAVSRESVAAAVKKYMTLDKMVTVVVGERSVLAPLLRKANVPFVERDAMQFL